MDIFCRMEDMSKIDPMTFTPFGTGPRSCIAKRLALLEIKLACCKILQNFILKPCENTPVSFILNLKLSHLCGRLKF